MKTFSAKSHEVVHEWYVVDASDKILGRFASRIALRLRGKHKAEYTPHVDTGDYIIITNAEKIKVTGRKFKNKIYYRHTNYTGGIKSESFDKLQARDPKRILELAIKGMLPKNSLGRQMLKKLKIYIGEDHPHSAQQPKPLEIGKQLICQ